MDLVMGLPKTSRGHDNLKAIIDRRMKRLRSKDVALAKVVSWGPSGEETTWEPKAIRREKTHTFLICKFS